LIRIAIKEKFSKKRRKMIKRELMKDLKGDYKE